jgi:hypothetical protein
MVDGEGSIYITIHRRKGYRVGFDPWITVNNTNTKMLKWIKIAVNGGYIVERRQRGFPNRKICYVLRFSSNVIRALLPKLMYALIIKKRQALLMMEFMKHKHVGGILSEKDYKSQQRIYIKMKSLNVRGIKVEHAQNGI